MANDHVRREGPPDDEAEFLAFYCRERPRLARTLAAVASDTRFVDDMVQDALLIARHKWKSIRDLDRPGAWVAKVAVRLLWRHQQSSRDRYVSVLEEESDLLRPRFDDIAAEHQDLYSAIRRLPPRQREAIAMYYLLDYPINTVADIMGVTSGTVKTNLHHARRNLQQTLGDGPRWEGAGNGA